MSGAVLAVDPGREKCGVAVLAADGTVLLQKVVPTAQLAATAAHIIHTYAPTVIMGNGTTSAAARARIEELGTEVTLVDEYRTTDAAKAAYWAAHPPRGWRWLIPRGMLVPPVPVDDFVAVILAQRYLTEVSQLGKY